MTDIIMIPLSKLIEDKENVRKTGRKDGIGELAASILAHGLLQSLVVKEAEKGKYAVSAGGRRLRALRLLAKSGDIDKSKSIPCRVVTADQAAEASLAENVVRSNMHPADEIEAFARLVEAGEGPESIGARFGVSGIHVARRLKLARVSPKLVEAFRRDELDLDQLSALAFSDDHAAQEAAFFQAPDWARTPERLRAQLAQAHVPSTDKLVSCVGLDAYSAAGGRIVEDLFAEGDGDVRWLADRDLLVRLAEEKLSALAETTRGEGWAWGEIAIDGIAWSEYPQRIREERRVLSETELAEQERLYERLDATEDEAEIERIEAEIDAMAPASWNSEEVALAGAIITLSHDGTPKVERGLVRGGDVKALKALRRKSEKGGEADNGEAPIEHETAHRGLSAKLVEELMAHKTLGLRAELVGQPLLVLRLLVFTLAERARNGGLGSSCLGVRVEDADVARSITRSESRAEKAFAKTSERRLAVLPTEPEALWDVVAGADIETLFDLLAVLVAPSIDLRVNARGEGTALINRFVAASGLDMAKWWSATPASFFEHVRKDVLIETMLEISPALDRSKLDKASRVDLVARAKRTVKKGWLPRLLRQKSDAQPDVMAVAAE